MNWHPVELHTHTEHSDGDFTVRQLAKAAKTRGFEAVALTDHNTSSGMQEFYKAAQREGLIAISGIEWTTYWGHMLVLGEQGYTDWRGVQPERIDDAIANIHRNRGIVGIAHPFALSNPVNTGYHWEFQIANWDAVDFLEVWSRDDAPRKIQSLRAFGLWEQLLSRGCRITATSGRDWHREDSLAYAHTYIGTEQPLTPDGIVQAVRKGRVCLSVGPLLTMRIPLDTQTCAEIGDEIPDGLSEVEIFMQTHTMEHDWDRTQVVPKEIQLIHNGLVIKRCAVTAHQVLRVPLAAGWLRADLIGEYYGKTEQHLAFTNPIFIR